MRKSSWTFEDALVEVLRGRLEGLGPVTVEALADSFGLSKSDIELGLLKLEAEGFVIRGQFTPGATETEWCARRLLARIHSYTLNRLRQEIEPVATADFMRYLLAWQKLAPEHQMEGPESVRAIIEQLEGFEAPAAAWEGELLPSRLAEYDPAWLDALCLSGEVVWARLTPPATPSRRNISRTWRTNERVAPLRCATLPSRCCGARTLRSGIRCFRNRRLSETRIFNYHARGPRLSGDARRVVLHRHCRRHQAPASPG